MRALRAENLKLTSDTARLTEKHTEAQRKADLASAAETTLKTQLKSADANIKALKEEAARMKTLVAQSRASCATELRRRDRQIDTLKKQLGEAGRSRGSRGNPAVTTITVSSEFGQEKDNMTLTGSLTNYDSELRAETNTALANLAQHLTEENDTLLGVMQQAMAQLRDMSGWTGDRNEDDEVLKRPNCEDMAEELDSVMDHMRTILTNPSFVPIEEVVLRDEEINRLKTGWVKMETRWEDAVHLIDSWRKRMAATGRPVCDEELQMGLRLSPVRVNDVEETKGPGAGVGVGLSVVKEESEEQAHTFLRSPCPTDREQRRPIFEAETAYHEVEEGSESDMSDYEGNAPVDQQARINNDEDLSNQLATEPDEEQYDALESMQLPEPPQLSPLRNSNSAANRGFLRNDKIRSRPSGLSTNDFQAGQNQSSESKSMRSQPVRPRSLATQSRLPSRIQRPVERHRSPSRTSLDDVLLSKRDDEMDERDEPELLEEHSQETEEIIDTTVHTKATTKRQQASRVTSHTKLPRTAEPQPQQSPLTMSNIAAKLAASEKEADAARVRAKLRAARDSSRGVSRPVLPKSVENEVVEADIRQTADVKGKVAEAGDPVEQAPAQTEENAKPEKRKRDRKVSKAASRRRSTLSPWELETLITGNAQ